MTMGLANRLRAARELAGLSARDVANLAEVAPSTVTRVEAGALPNVSWEVALRLLRATDLGPDLNPVSTPTAIASARLLLGDEVPEPSDFSYWCRRWQTLRMVGDDRSVRDPRSLAFRAGRSGLLMSRPQVVSLSRDITWTEAGRRLERSGLAWANTGDSAANRIVEVADQPWPVFYVESVPAAVQALGLPVLFAGQRGPRITLIPFDGFSEVGRWQDSSGAWYAAPWQVVMDCYGGVQRMLVQAEEIVDLWRQRQQ